MSLTNPGSTVPAPPRVPALDRQTSSRLAAEELARVGRLLTCLSPGDWSRPTDCPGWDVRALSTHLLGMAEMFSSFPRNARQHLPAARAAKRGEVYIDALTARQVADRSALKPNEVVRQLAAAAPRNVRWRRKAPGVLRRRAMPDAQLVGQGELAALETWTFGFLFDVILTRDAWMHRVDIARATEKQLELSPDHDGVLVADVVAEWASRHDQPYDLTLTGPAGGSWSRGGHGPAMTVDAVEFCRALSGRGPAAGLLSVSVPF